MPEKKEKSFGKRLKGWFGGGKKKGQESSASAAPQGSPNHLGVISASPMPMERTPAFWEIGAGYSMFAEKAQKLSDSDSKHAKKTEVEKLAKEKADLDSRYTEAVNTPVEMKGMTGDIADEKEVMEQRKANADTIWEGLEDRVAKQVEFRENLEKHRGNAVVRLVKHAYQIQDREDKINNNAPEAARLRAERAAEKNKSKKREKGDDRMEKVGFVATISQYLSTIFGAISDGLGTLADMGVDTKNSAESLKAGEEPLKNVLKDNVGGVDGGFSNLTVIISLGNAIISAVELGRGVVHAVKRRKDSDAQEKWLDARILLGNICDAISNMLGVAAPFTALVPFLGPALNIGDNALQMIVGSMNLVTNLYHKHQTSVQKDKLWAEIERKRKKYAGKEDAKFFDIETGKDPDKKRKLNWSRIDAKRKELQRIVAQDAGIQRERIEKKDARNKTGYAAAETGISSRISRTRKEWHERNSASQTAAAKSAYKKKIHAMEALELLSQYRNAEKAGKKMSKASGHDIEGLITNSVNIVAEALKLVGEATAATGFGAAMFAAGTIVSISEGGYEMGREGASKLYKVFRKLYGSEKNKENTRSEMAEYLYDKMLSVSPANVEWEGDFFKLDDSVKDYRVREESRSMDELYGILRQGLDARVSLLVNAPTPKDMKKAMAAAFSQDGNVSFAQDGM